MDNTGQINTTEMIEDSQVWKDKSQSIKKEERSKLLQSSLASAVLSLFISLLNKQNPLKYKSFLVVLIKISTFLMENDGFRRSYRKQGAIKSMIKLIKDILSA